MLGWCTAGQVGWLTVPQVAYLMADVSNVDTNMIRDLYERLEGLECIAALSLSENG